jgi:hypothetical protein
VAVGSAVQAGVVFFSSRVVAPNFVRCQPLPEIN